jgi:hypothetical protein
MSKFVGLVAFQVGEKGEQREGIRGYLWSDSRMLKDARG